MSRKRFEAEDIDYSCPKLDEIIKQAEIVRSINDELRSLAIRLEKRDEYEEQAEKLAGEVDDLKDQIQSLQEDIRHYERELA